MRKLISGLAGLGLSAALVLVLASPALAGGWAVTTLDPMGTPVAGVPIEIGFWIRQHGITPVALDDVAIEVTSPSGETSTFAAKGEGADGHYVARVTFAEGVSTWSVRQGWFSPQALGTITAAPATATADAAAVESSSYRWPGALRALVPIAAIALGAFAIGDAISGRRRRRDPADVAS